MAQYEIKLEKYTGEHNNVPQLVVNVMESTTGNVVLEAYLSAITRVSFLVSGDDKCSDNGIADSPTINLKRFIDDPDAEVILMSQAMLALHKFSTSPQVYHACEWNNAVIPAAKNTSTVSTWIRDEVIPWLKTL